MIRRASICSLLDKSRALIALGQAEKALEVSTKGLAMRPQGRIGNGLRLAVGDAEAALGDLDEAIAQYVVVAELVDDKEMRPQALRKLIAALDKKGDKPEADRYRKVLKAAFPDAAN